MNFNGRREFRQYLKSEFGYTGEEASKIVNLGEDLNIWSNGYMFQGVDLTKDLCESLKNYNGEHGYKYAKVDLCEMITGLKYSPVNGQLAYTR
jgi:hypothetical protein